MNLESKISSSLYTLKKQKMLKSHAHVHNATISVTKQNPLWRIIYWLRESVKVTQDGYTMVNTFDIKIVIGMVLNMGMKRKIVILMIWMICYMTLRLHNRVEIGAVVTNQLIIVQMEIILAQIPFLNCWKMQKRSCTQGIIFTKSCPL